MEDESRDLFFSMLPSEWIKRRIENDYGVDLEIELVDDEEVTGNRLWVQLKAAEKCQIRKFRVTDDLLDKRDLRGASKFFGLRVESHGEAVARYVSFSIQTRHLRYSLRCPFPLLLVVADLDREDVYWLPLRDAITYDLTKRTPNWLDQGSATLRLPLWSSLKHAQEDAFYSLRWYSLEPARMNVFSALAYLDHKLSYQAGILGAADDFMIELELHPDRTEELVHALKAIQRVLQQARSFDPLYGVYGLLRDDFPGVLTTTIQRIEDTKTYLQSRPTTIDPDVPLIISDAWSLWHRLQSANNLYHEFRFTHVITESSVTMRALT